MLKTVLRVLIALIVLTLVGVVGLYFYNLNRTYYNKEDEIGNSTGNIYNGGLFCEQDNNIYFSNDYDSKKLYVMNSSLKNIKKVSDDKAAYINVDENYLYYVRINDAKDTTKKSLMEFNNNGIYRINQNGTHLKAITGNPGAYLLLKGNNLYYQKYDADTGLNIYSNKIDASLERLIVKEAVVPAGEINNALFYVGNAADHNISSLSLASYVPHTIYEGSFLYPIFMGNYVYYIDITEKNKIYRMALDGSDLTKLVNKKCSTYNITNSGTYLYYLIDDNKNNSIHRLNLQTMVDEFLQAGNFKQINVTDNYVFFKDLDNTNTYFLEADGSNVISTFDTLLPKK